MRRLEFSSEPTGQRYFLLGGSAALGQQPVNIKTKMNWPTIRLDNSVLALDEQVSISGHLESRLKKASLKAEVLNAGIIAQDSGGLRRIAKQCLEFKPTGLLLYLGNNEGIGMALGMEGETLPLVPEVRSLLRSSRLMRVVLDQVLLVKQHREQNKTTTLHGSTPEVLGKLIQTQWRAAGKPLFEEGSPTDSVYHAISRRFKENLRRIVLMAKENNTQTYILPIAPHLGYAPFFDANDPSLIEDSIFNYSKHMEKAQKSQRNKDWETARESLVAAIRIDRTHATSWYQLGTVLNNLGRYEESWTALNRAVVLDLSRKRSLPNFGSLAQEVCAELGCKTLDLHQRQRKDYLTTGLALYDERYGDHEHLTPKGCDWVAEAFSELILNE